MASGNTLLVLYPQDDTPPATLYAPLDIMVGTSVPAESIPVLDFNDATVVYADFLCVMPSHYGGGGITLKIKWSCAQTINTAVWAAALRRVADDVEDLDTTVQTYDYNATGALTPPSVVGEVAYDNLAFTAGADMDNVVAGDLFILRVRRDRGDANDTVSGDCSIHAIEIIET